MNYIHPLTGPLAHTTAAGEKWTIEVGWGERNGDTGLVVRFGKVTCFYPDTPERMYFDMLATDSAGGYVHENLYWRRYIKV